MSAWNSGWGKVEFVGKRRKSEKWFRKRIFRAQKVIGDNFPLSFGGEEILRFVGIFFFLYKLQLEISWIFKLLHLLQHSSQTGTLSVVGYCYWTGYGNGCRSVCRRTGWLKNGHNLMQLSLVSLKRCIVQGKRKSFVNNGSIFLIRRTCGSSSALHQVGQSYSAQYSLSRGNYI